MNFSSDITAGLPELPTGSRVAVLQGGPGSEREVSLHTAAAVAGALRESGMDVHPVDVRDAGFQLPEQACLAFIALHGVFGEDGGVQAELERRRIPYTGAGVAASALAFDKAASKERFLARGVPTPRSRVASAGDLGGLEAPVVLKPLREGSSVGVQVVRDAAKLDAAIEEVFKHGDTALVEDFVEGRELTVGIIADRPLPVVEILPRDGFYDMANKYPWMGKGGGTDYVCPAGLSAAEAEAVTTAAVAAHRALGIEVYSRVDVLLDANGRPWVLEANTIPGMTPSSLLPKAAAAVGLGFNDLCLLLARLSLAVARRGESPCFPS